MQVNNRFKYYFAMIWVLFLISMAAFPMVSIASQTAMGVRAEPDCTEGLPDDIGESLSRLRTEYQLNGADMAGFVDILLSACHQSMPLSNLLDKIAEGLAKRVRPEIIRSVLKQRIFNFKFVQDLIAGKYSAHSTTIEQEPLTMIVDSLSSGLTNEDLEDFVLNAPSAPTLMLAVGVENYALLLQAQFDKSAALQMLYTGLKQKRLDATWRHMASFVVRARQNGVTEKYISAAAQRALMGDGHFSDFLQEIGLTSRNLEAAP